MVMRVRGSVWAARLLPRTRCGLPHQGHCCSKVVQHEFPPSPQKRLGVASADSTWPPTRSTRVEISIYDFAIKLYDALVFDNQATAMRSSSSHSDE